MWWGDLPRTRRVRTRSGRSTATCFQTPHVSCSDRSTPTPRAVGRPGEGGGGGRGGATGGWAWRRGGVGGVPPTAPPGPHPLRAQPGHVLPDAPCVLLGPLDADT